MWQKISEFPIIAYLTVTGAVSRFVKDLRDDENGLDGPVAAILLILVAVLAIILLWTSLRGWLVTTWTNITTQSGTIT